MNQKIILITGCSSNHYKSLLQFINSFKKYENEIKLIIYDLGLSQSELLFLRNSFNYEVNCFNYSKYPPFVNIKINAGEYAWKPILINEVFEKNRNSIIIWMDSGNLFQSDLNDLVCTIKNNKIYSPSSSGTIKDWTHPKTLKFMKFDDNFSLRNRNGACVGFDCTTDWVEELIKEWTGCSLIKECIAPDGSSRKNHRQDQSLLTILYYKYHKEHKFEIINEYIGFTIHNDIEKDVGFPIKYTVHN